MGRPREESMANKPKLPAERYSSNKKARATRATAKPAAENYDRVAKQAFSKRVSSDGDRPLSVVGIGASAGGLEASEQLLRALPADTGLAFVLVQHLAPKHESILSELLGKATAMAVIEVSQGMRVQA